MGIRAGPDIRPGTRFAQGNTTQMTLAHIAAFLILQFASTVFPHYGGARPEALATSEMSRNSGAIAVIALVPVDPVIAGGTGHTVADTAWLERASERRRCMFCSGYQPFPRD